MIPILSDTFNTVYSHSLNTLLITITYTSYLYPLVTLSFVANASVFKTNVK